MLDLLSSGNPPRSAAERLHVNEIKSWLLQGLSLGDSTVITVNQVRCQDPGCPDLETIITILAEGLPAWAFKVPSPILEITEDRILQITRKHQPNL